MEVDEVAGSRRMTASASLRVGAYPDADQFIKILGIRFFTGDAHEGVALMKNGGLLVAPAGPLLNDLARDEGYREAISSADVAITDSGAMVLVWNLLNRERIRRVSGLEYFRQLVREPEFRVPGATFWVMASDGSSRINRQWLLRQSIPVTDADVYIAPWYSGTMADPVLLQRIEERRPANIVITIGGGKQERLGLYLKRGLSYRPAIHCIGAAIGFVSGDQVRIPMWADRLRIGWLFRCMSNPGRYVPRYWRARGLPALIVKYRDRAPIAN